MKVLLAGLAMATMAVFTTGAYAQTSSGTSTPPAAQSTTPSPDDQKSNMVEMPAANWLFVQTADSFTSDGKTLTLKGINPQTLMFSDRPERMTGDASTAKFVEFWNKGKDSFEKDPPNASISTGVDGKTDIVIVELLNPRLEGDTLTYDIKPLSGELPQSGQQATIFIDWWYGPGWRHRWGWGWGPGPWAGGGCWRGPYGGLHCRPWWAY
ncbi:hypothetical protein [Rhodoligotrophos defluvii]|uniref:hypothetical protein n=1 Tax=Rhodoligotrophos defluvii TaxID=2561934 RepID=UPI0010CA0A71|nr:hypothetical protein [Rhodoligotrophos defluvii]